MKKKKKTNWKVFIISWTLIWVIYTLIWLLAQENLQRDTAEQPKTPLTSEERERAIQPCMDEGGSRGLCECVVDELTHRFTLFELGQMNLEQNVKGKSTVAMEIAAQCHYSQVIQKV